MPRKDRECFAGDASITFGDYVYLLLQKKNLARCFKLKLANENIRNRRVVDDF